MKREKTLIGWSGKMTTLTFTKKCVREITVKLLQSPGIRVVDRPEKTMERAHFETE